MGPMYLRQCESAAVAQEKFRKSLRMHGTKTITIDYKDCDYDGSYSPYSILNEMCVIITSYLEYR